MGSDACKDWRTDSNGFKRWGVSGMGRAGRLHKPALSGSHATLNTALHELHKGAGLISISAMAHALNGAGISRSTIYDAFASMRLPSWEVVDALVEILATKHPQTSPKEVQPRFHELWLSAVDEEADGIPAADKGFPQHSVIGLPGPPRRRRSPLESLRAIQAEADEPPPGVALAEMLRRWWQQSSLNGQGKPTQQTLALQVGVAKTALSRYLNPRHSSTAPLPVIELLHVRLRAPASELDQARALHEAATTRVWLSVPSKDRDRVKELGGRWDPVERLWYAVDPGPELRPWH
jgi:hypothetical protein